MYVSNSWIDESTYLYVNVVINSQHRAALSQFRCDVLPLKESGIFQDIHLENRLCTICEENAIETE